MTYRNPDTNPELHDLARFLEGYMHGLADQGAGQTATKIGDAVRWLDKFAPHVCAHGIVGCDGGPTCGSDHK